MEYEILVDTKDVTPLSMNYDMEGKDCDLLSNS